MERETLARMRKEAQRIFLASLKAVDPFEAVRQALSLEGEALRVLEDGSERIRLDLSQVDRILVVGGGKATAPMARAVEEILGDRISGGIITVKVGFGEPLSKVSVVEAGHPLPDEAGVEGTRQILSLLRRASESDLVISLISGGGSALLTQPAPGITLEDLRAVTQALLACGASIDEMNAMRKHLSLCKGGQMARAAQPARVINLMLSDVVGDRMDVIASGPFVPDHSTYQEVQAVVEKYALHDLPSSVIRHIREGLEGRQPETPKQGDPAFLKVVNLIVGSNILALEAAEREARLLGYHTLILSSMVEGETREVARVHTAVAKEILRTSRPLKAPACVISGGETTVTLRGDGMGGRNQEFCLSAALDLEGLPPRMVVLSGGTDGNDGPTDAAGGVVDPLTVKRGRALGLDPWESLRQNDAYTYLSQTGDLLITGPTRTNVMDVHLILVG